MTDTTAALDQVRAEINSLDARLVGLIAERETLVRRAGALKASTQEVRAPARVQQVIERVRAEAVAAHGDPEVVEATYRAMIAAFIELELRVHREG